MDDNDGFRPPMADEVRLMRAAAARSAEFAFAPGWLDEVRVRPLSDGGMGSLRLRTPSTPSEAACAFGRPLGEFRFPDADGVEVLVTLTSDNFGGVYELDVWKTDFSAVVRVPGSDAFH